MIVEGTMRNPDVPIQTTSLLRKKGYSVGIAVIAVHNKITELGVYRRYIEQQAKFGHGRLADMQSHNDAYNGLLVSTNKLYLSQAVNFIKIYSYLGQSLITEYKLINGKWTNPELPATAIIYERQRQANDKELLETQIQSGKELLSKHDIEPAIAKNISFVVSDLEKLYKQRNN